MLKQLCSYTVSKPAAFRLGRIGLCALVLTLGMLPHLSLSQEGRLTVADWEHSATRLDSLRRIIYSRDWQANEEQRLLAKARMAWELVHERSPYRLDTQAVRIANEVLYALRPDDESMAKLFAARALAILYRRAGDLYHEILYGDISLSLARRHLTDDAYAFYIHYEYVLTLYRMEQWDKLLTLERQAAVVFERMNKPVYCASVYAMMGNAFDQFNQHDSARVYFARSYRIYERNPDLPPVHLGKGYVRVNQAELFIEEGLLDSAEVYLKDALKHMRDDRRYAGVHSDILSNLALVYLRQRKTELAYATAQRSLAFNQLVPEDHTGRRDAYEMLYRASLALSRHAEALAHFRYYMAADQLVKADAQKIAIAEREYRLKLNEQAAEIDRRDQALETGRAQRNTLIIGVVLGLAVLVVLGWSYRNARESNRLMAEQKAQIERQKADLERSQTELVDSNEELKQTLQELERTQAQLLVNEKRTALGHLVANISHELNSPLAAISAATQQSQHLMPELAAQLPRALAELSPVDRSRYLQLIDDSLRDANELSTRDERQRRRDLMLVLKGWEQSDELRPLAESLVRLRPSAPVGELVNLTSWLMRHPRRDVLVEAARVLVVLTRNQALVSENSARVTQLVRALRQFTSEGEEGLLREADLILTIETVLTVYDSAFKRGIRVERRYPTDRPVMRLRVESIELVWSQLVRNAIQAMPPPRGGVLTVIVAPDSDGQGVYIRFIDTGVGIAPEVLPQIFEPFFSTRPAGEGAGLGLSLAQRIVSQHGGQLSAHSAGGETSLTVWLPWDNRAEQRADGRTADALGLGVKEMLVTQP